MSAGEPPHNPENAKQGPSSAKKRRSMAFSKDQPRNMRFSEPEIAAINHIHETFPHLVSQVDAVRYAVRCFAAGLNPRPLQFRSLDANIIFIVQGILDEIHKVHRENHNKILRLRPKDEKTQTAALKTLKVIESETANLARVTRELAAHCKISSEMTPEDIQNIKASMVGLEKSIKALQDNGKDASAKQYLSVLKVLKGLVA